MASERRNGQSRGSGGAAGAAAPVPLADGMKGVLDSLLVQLRAIEQEADLAQRRMEAQNARIQFYLQQCAGELGLSDDQCAFDFGRLQFTRKEHAA